jgi:hypothetical protein
MGAIVLVSTLGAFFGGLLVGWQIFGNTDEEGTEETDGSQGKVTYHGMATAPSTPTEETPT